MSPNPTGPLCPIHMLKHNVIVSGGGAFRKRLGHEGEYFVNGISALVKDPESFLTSSSMWGHSKRWIRNWTPMKHWLWGAMIMDVPACMTVRDRFLLFISPQPIVFWYCIFIIFSYDILFISPKTIGKLLIDFR